MRHSTQSVSQELSGASGNSGIRLTTHKEPNNGTRGVRSVASTLVFVFVMLLNKWSMTVMCIMGVDYRTAVCQAACC